MPNIYVVANDDLQFGITLNLIIKEDREKYFRQVYVSVLGVIFGTQFARHNVEKILEK